MARRWHKPDVGWLATVAVFGQLAVMSALCGGIVAAGVVLVADPTAAVWVPVWLASSALIGALLLRKWSPLWFRWVTGRLPPSKPSI